jgi:hypothetical protein
MRMKELPQVRASAIKMIQLIAFVFTAAKIGRESRWETPKARFIGKRIY